MKSNTFKNREICFKIYSETLNSFPVYPNVLFTERLTNSMH